MSEPPSAAPRYTFGDSPLASARLALLAELLAPPSRALLRGMVAGPPRVALDLGCGPGYTTVLLAETTGAARTVGLDSSATFVGAAQRAFPNLCFLVHDVTVTPFPVAKPDLIFARLVLAHLPDPAGQAQRWGHELAPGGRLVLDELDSLEAPDPVLRRYEELVGAVVADRGASMHAGSLLAELTTGPDLTVQANCGSTLAVPVPVAARLYEMNLDVWRHDPYAQANLAAAELDDLANGLAALTRTGRGHVDWHLRQVVLERPH